MSNQWIDWISDLSQYAKQFGRRALAGQKSGGVDYSDPRFQNLVRTTVERIHPKKMALKISEVIDETPSAKTLRFVRTDGALPPFRAGQYVNLYVEIDGVLTSRPYSIASESGADFIDLTLRKMTKGFVSQYLIDHAKSGDEFTSSGPAGSFYFEPLIDGRELVFLAGGSGITPFMSMLRNFAQAGGGPRIWLIYGNRNKKDVIFHDELTALTGQLPGFVYEPVFSEAAKGDKGRKGLIDAKAIGEIVGDVTDKKFFICGPNAMYDFCLDQLKGMGVPEFRIKRELYGPPDDVTRQPGWPKKLKGKESFEVAINGKTIQALSGEPLMNSLERNGIVVPALCRSGECSACRLKIEQGRVYMPPATGIREADLVHGYAHACVSYPIEDLKIRM